MIFSSLCCLSLVLAGCSGGPFSSLTDGNDVPFGGSPTLDTVEYPPGASKAGFTDPSRIVNNSSVALAERSYTMRAVISSTDGQRTWNRIQYFESNPTEPAAYTLQKFPGDTHEEYVNRSGRYFRCCDEDPSYGYDTPEQWSPHDVHQAGIDTSTRYLEVALEIGEYTATDVIQREGTTLIVYNLTEPAETYDNRSITAAKGHLLVDQQGVVHGINLYVAGSRLDEPRSYTRTKLTYRVTLTESVTVEKPAWVENVTTKTA
ncbi:hypothetical protein ACFQDQ_11470 [Haladaptatus sp. GCM10026878]|uniref:hypothetical protein n=2 Tax=Haladaptatus TaxID=367188 RepID=UPI00361DC549